ncbi:MAG: hypothetical protein ABI761_10645 [Saprospiraceae bacterium]
MHCSNLILFFAFALNSVVLNAQPDLRLDSLFLFRSLPLHAQSLYTDGKNQIYVITNKNEIILLNPVGEIVQKYSNNYLGTPQFIYFQNPLQVLLFYPDFQTLVTLDRSLTELNRILLVSYGLYHVNTIGYSPDKSIWYLDETSGRIKKINQSGNIELDIAVSPLSGSKKLREIRARKNEILFVSDLNEYTLMNSFGVILFSKKNEGNLIDWNEKDFLFFDSLAQKIIYWNENEVENFPLPGNLTSLNKIGLISDGLTGINQSGEVLVYHYK